MRILALADIHGDRERLGDILSTVANVDLVLVAGDLTEFGNATELDAVVACFGGFHDRLVAVPGNCDRKGARERLAALGLSADDGLVERGGILTAGVGGGVLRTGLTPYERKDEDMATALRESLDEGSYRSGEGMPLIALSHQPPKDSGADERHGSAVGSRALRGVLDVAGPALWVCGHIHESPSVKRFGPCLVVNPGPVNEGRYAMASLERDAGGVWRAEAELFG